VILADESRLEGWCLSLVGYSFNVFLCFSVYFCIINLGQIQTISNTKLKRKLVKVAYMICECEYVKD
jgi:hypothetical protein